MEEQRNIIIEYIYSEKWIDEIIKNVGVRDSDKADLMQEVYLILLEYDVDKLQGMMDRGELKWFIVKVLKNQYFSKNSPYYKKYKKYYTLIDNNFNRNNLIEIDEDSEIDE